jgi:hypothetical protein
MATLRDRLGHFLPQGAQAAEAEVVDVVAEAAAADLVPLDPFTLTAEIVSLRDQIEELRDERKELLTIGDIDRVAEVDAAIARAEIGRESLGARLGAAQAEQATVEHGRRRQAQQAFLPRLLAAHAERNYAAYALMGAIGHCVTLEAEAAGLDLNLGDHLTPASPPYTQYLLDRWIDAHLRKSPRAA